jgi:NDP-sugar pyrophosphorylase family protein
LVIHSDNYFDSNLKTFISFCKKNISFRICLLAFRTNDYKNTGILNIDRKNILKKIYEKKKTKKGIWANSAVYYFSKNTIKDLKKEKKNFDIAKDLLKKYYDRTIVCKTKKFFIDVGIKKNLKKLNYSL